MSQEELSSLRDDLRELRRFVEGIRVRVAPENPQPRQVLRSESTVVDFDQVRRKRREQ
jgi:hypothetical protein